jgi:hypothetical protein
VRSYNETILLSESDCEEKPNPNGKHSKLKKKVSEDSDESFIVSDEES